MKDKNCNKPQYTCGVCGTNYDSIQERAECEMTCVKKIKEEERKAAEAKKKAEKAADFAEASAAIDNVYAMINKCVEKHGEFTYSDKLKDCKEPIVNYFPSRFWHHFFF